MHCGFEPDPARAKALDRRMRCELASSLLHIADRVGDALRIDDRSIRALCRRITDGGVPALAFAGFYDLVRAIDADDPVGAIRLLSEISAAIDVAEATTLEVRDLRLQQDWSRRYAALVQAEGSLALVDPVAEASAAFRPTFDAARRLLQFGAPELAGEIEAIIHEVVLVAQRPDTRIVFDGGSHYQLWGALFLNIGRERSVTQLAEVIAHEAGHSFLFGMTVDEPLTLNEDDELYASPLRDDLRPVDGIYHAAFVSARMHWALSRLAGSDVLDVEGREVAAVGRSRAAADFAASRSVVREHGRLSATGDAILAAAEGYMACAA